MVSAPNHAAARPRVIVLTDFYKDPDDKQSLIRFLSAANEFEVEELIATSLAYGDPSGDPTPSEADIKITRLIRAGQLLKIEALDHIVVGHPSHLSLRNLFFFYS